MSLSRLAVRIAAVRALRGATLAEGRVYDSAITPLDQTVREAPEPFLIVTTDTHERDITGRDLAHGADSLELVIEAAIASRVVATAPDGAEVVTVEIPNTDAGLEMTLDLIEGQIARAMMDARAGWGLVLSRLILSFSRRLSRRGASAEDGIRYAARQIVLTCNPVADPVPGLPVPEGGAWAAFLAAAEADPGLAPVVPLLRAQIEAPEAQTWEQMAAALALPASAVAASGMGPEVVAVGGGPVLVERIDADDPADAWPALTITEDEADDQGV